jgi:hypothetical protein
LFNIWKLLIHQSEQTIVGSSCAQFDPSILVPREIKTGKSS